MTTHWHDRWREGRIGFHEGQPNAWLSQHLEVLGERQTVLVPLCGKAVDLAFLAERGHRVVGVELVEDAVRSYFSERGLVPEVQPRGGLRSYSVGMVTLLAGDFFATTPELVGSATAFYDRAALIALPADLRGRYVQHLRGLLPPQSRGLLITVEYPQAELDGPPFSVPEAEVRAHYVGAQVDSLGEGPALGGRLEALGSRARERCFRVTL